jgi:hypothetical protein
MEMVSEYPQLAAIHARSVFCLLNIGVVAADHASALAFEVLRGSAPGTSRIPPNQVEERDK